MELFDFSSYFLFQSCIVWSPGVWKFSAIFLLLISSFVPLWYDKMEEFILIFLRLALCFKI
jgi:hypothetical protein